MVSPLRHRFRQLHDGDLFVMPNPWDVGSARLFASLGFPALATTSSGHAASLGRPDQHVTRDELLAHAAALAAAVEVPLNVDAEHGFAAEPTGVAETVGLIAETGAAGCSIEDYDPVAAAVEPVAVAAERVGAAAEIARREGMVLTARAENHLHGVTDLDDTVGRLRAYRDAGADVAYAPGLTEAGEIARVVREVGLPVNVLALRRAPAVAELAALGVRRVSTGGALAKVAYGAALAGAREIRDSGTFGYAARGLAETDAEAAFAAPP